MRIYISATFTAQQRLRAEAQWLQDAGHHVLSDWLYEPAQPAHLNTDQFNRALAYKDIAQVFASDCIILDLAGESTTGGRYTEWGIAICPGHMKLRYTVGGNRAGVFNTLADRHFEAWQELRAFFNVNHAAR